MMSGRQRAGGHRIHVPLILCGWAFLDGACRARLRSAARLHARLWIRVRLKR